MLLDDAALNHLTGTILGSSYRVDVIVEDRVIVEVKSVEALAPVYKAQVLTYICG